MAFAQVGGFGAVEWVLCAQKSIPGYKKRPLCFKHVKLFGSRNVGVDAKSAWRSLQPVYAVEHLHGSPVKIGQGLANFFGVGPELPQPLVEQIGREVFAPVGFKNKRVPRNHILELHQHGCGVKIEQGVCEVHDAQGVLVGKNGRLRLGLGLFSRVGPWVVAAGRKP